MARNNIKVVIAEPQVHSFHVHEQTFYQVRSLELYLVLLKDEFYI